MTFGIFCNLVPNDMYAWPDILIPKVGLGSPSLGSQTGLRVIRESGLFVVALLSLAQHDPVSLLGYHAAR